MTSDSGGIAIHRSRVESQVGVREVYERLLGSVVRRGETETVGYTVENPCRGIYTGGEVVIESRAPFGHYYGRRSTPAASDTVVYPRTFDVAGLPPSAVTGAEWGEEAAGPVATATGTLMRGVARLDPASITLVGLLVGGAYLVFFYTRKFVAYRSRETLVVRPIKVSDARLYSRYKKITTALEEIGIVREPHETLEQYARRAAHGLHEPGLNRLGEIYLYARFRDAVPATLVEEFDRLESKTLPAIERVKEAQTVSR